MRACNTCRWAADYRVTDRCIGCYPPQFRNWKRPNSNMRISLAIIFVLLSPILAMQFVDKAVEPEIELDAPMIEPEVTLEAYVAGLSDADRLKLYDLIVEPCSHCELEEFLESQPEEVLKVLFSRGK